MSPDHDSNKRDAIQLWVLERWSYESTYFHRLSSTCHPERCLQNEQGHAPAWPGAHNRRISHVQKLKESEHRLMRHHPRLLLLHGFCAGRAHGRIRAPASGTCSDRGNGTMHRSAAWIGINVAGSFLMRKIVLGWHSQVPDSLLLFGVATIPPIRSNLLESVLPRVLFPRSCVFASRGDAVLPSGLKISQREPRVRHVCIGCPQCPQGRAPTQRLDLSVS